MKRLFGAIKNNFGLKIMAVLFAVVLWSYVLTDANPARSKTVRNVPITIQGTESLSDRDMVVAQQYMDLLNTTVDVVVTTRFTEEDLDQDDIVVVADLSKAKEPGTFPVQLEARVRTSYGEIERVLHDDILIGISRVESKQVPVEIDLRGNAANNYAAFVDESEPESITIAGAAADLERIESARCLVDVNGLNEDVEREHSVMLVDADGNQVKLGSMAAPEQTVSMTVRVLPTKVVPVVVDITNIADIATLPSGYEVESITCNVESATVIADAAALVRITSLQVEKINISGATEEITVTARIIRPTEARQITPATVRITVKIVRSAVDNPEQPPQ